MKTPDVFSVFIAPPLLLHPKIVQGQPMQLLLRKNLPAAQRRLNMRVKLRLAATTPNPMALPHTA
jgi:hypothetical protein